MHKAASLRESRLAGLDALRFAAATGVVITHYGMWLDVHGTGLFKCLGFCSVSVFFIISGHVITSSVNGARSRIVFLIRRFERLFPAFFLCLLISSAFRLKSGQHTSLEMFLGNLTMLPNLLDVPAINGVYWTLSFEWLFYFLVAFNLDSFRRRTEVFILCWLLAAILIRSSGTDWLLLQFGASCTYTPFFCAGIILSKWQSRQMRPITAVLFMSGITLFFGLFGLPDAISQLHLVFVYIGIFITCIFIVLFSIRADISVHLRHPCLSLGRVSYPLYLDHGISLSLIGGFLRNSGCPRLMLFIACFGLAILLGWLINKFFEIPMMKYLRKITDPLLTLDTHRSTGL